MIRDFLLCVIPILLFFSVAKAQPTGQVIKGKVTDVVTQVPLPGATVVVQDSDPQIGTITDENGNFRLWDIKPGRYNIFISFIGYENYLFREVLVGSGRQVILNAGLKESTEQIEEIEVVARSSKEQAINSMATLSARQLNMEEASRYAGGFDDPSRLVSSYAGVASTIGNNGIVIRGNSPKGLLWRMEGVQISNPNHFADYISLGGGAVTALSSQTIANSDFFTGAFPAEYGNALSGVFDVNIRTGNAEKKEHVFQAGAVGIDFASEGPFKKGSRSSYLFNYRYSTLGLLAPILPKEMGKLTYQDLSFKLNFPIKAGTISLWGIGAYDFQGKDAISDPVEWEENDDRKEFKTTLTMGAIGLNYKRIIRTKSYVHFTLAATENSLNWKQSRYSDDLIFQTKRKVDDYKWKYTFSGFLNHKFSAKHTNKTGFIIDRFMYDINIKNADDYGEQLQTYVSERNGSNLAHFYSQSKITPSNKLTFNIGFHSQYFGLTDKYTFEPRLGIRWMYMPRHTISFAYGLHSQLEILQLYMVQQELTDGTIIFPNKNLDFNKSNHFVFGYEVIFNKNLNLKIEPYYQKLFDIPVIPQSYVSTINMNEIWEFNDRLVNEGSGTNLGIDITLERFLNKGYYYLFTASLFDSKYKGGDGIQRNTKYNKNYVFNVLAGKEWLTGPDKKNLFNANIRFTYMGGNRIIPLDIAETMAKEEIVEDISRAYEKKLPDAPILSLSVNYRKNKPKYSSIWSFHLINALMHSEFQEYEFNMESGEIEKVEDLLIIPNISYKIEF